MEDSYNVLLTGRLVAGRESDEVRSSLAALFKTTPEAIGQLLAKAPVKVKGDVDHDTALQYKAAVEKAGALCEIDRVAQHDPAATSTAGVPVSEEFNSLGAEETPETPAVMSLLEEEPESEFDDRDEDPTPAPRDVYAPPSASLDQDLAYEEELTEPQKVSAGRAWAWIVEGFDSFKRSPLPWIGIIVVWGFLTILVSLIPMGQIASYIIYPIFVGGMMLGCQAQLCGEDLEFRHLFAGFSNHAKKLAALGGVYLGSLMVLFMVTGLVALILAVALGGGIETLMSIMNADSGPPGPEAVGGIIAVMILAFLIMFAGIMLVFMGMWFAPVLVVVHDLDVIEAIRLSFRGCLKNWVPFLVVYPLILMALSLVAMIPLFLGFLVLGPVVMASMFAGYRDIYTA